MNHSRDVLNQFTVNQTCVPCIARRRQRSAFTLLEVLIALGLTVLLVYAVYAGIDLCYRYRVAGRGEITGQQFLRGLTLRMQDDVNAVVLALPQETEASSEMGTGQATDDDLSSDSSSSSSSTVVVPVLSFDGIEDAGIPALAGVVGTADLLHLCVSQPTRELSYYSLNDRPVGDERTSDLQVISYGLVEIDSITLALLQQNLKVTRPDQGLGRRVRDLFAIVKVDEVLDSPNLMAAEVTELSFRYFDGVDWVESWDSLASGILPRAIHVTFGIWSPPPERLGGPLPGAIAKVTHIEHVFYLPASEPNPETLQ
ncbi:prepilin-type N-terminal cleavage/methylation domain-containing protein [Planctomicrobium sp. SH527]|uniref:PulJ/GspJ family protein n=1 Tax=Planctomicrobium sp. SH527 TaxID=3448123 RepID=UPI003F5BA546